MCICCISLDTLTNTTGLRCRYYGYLQIQLSIKCHCNHFSVFQLRSSVNALQWESHTHVNGSPTQPSLPYVSYTSIRTLEGTYRRLRSTSKDSYTLFPSIALAMFSPTEFHVKMYFILLMLEFFLSKNGLFLDVLRKARERRKMRAKLSREREGFSKDREPQYASQD